MLTGQSGPLVIYGGRSSNVSAQPGKSNPDLAPSGVAGGHALVDVRVGYDVTRTGWLGLGSAGYRRVLSAVPAAKAAANIAALANVVNGTAMTLVSSTGAGVTVVATATQVWASGNTVAVGSLALDGLPGLVSFGLANPSGNYKTSLYDNTKALSRAVSITGVSGGAGGAFLVAGADLYGYPQTETITAGAGVSTTNGKKAFKFIYSVTPKFTDAHNYSVGTADIFGLPLLANLFDQVQVWWNSAVITANTGFVVADATSPATATTGDVRGTYATQDAADGTKRLTFAIGIPESTCVTAAGMFGVTPA
jgi:hypothetical protein